MVANNPVGRLHDILIAMPASGKTIKQHLAEQFDVDQNDVLEILRLYADLTRLVEEGVRSVEHVPGIDVLEYVEPLRKVAEVLGNCSVVTTTSHLRGNISAETITALKYTSMLLSRDHPEDVVSTDDLDSLMQQVHDLHDEILSADIPSKLKDVLLRHIDELAYSIRNYRIHGTIKLRTALEGAVGAGAIEAKKSPNVAASEVLKNYADVCKNIIILLDLGFRTKELAEPLMKSLMG